MRELQVVGITSDGKHLILSESGHLVDDQAYLVRLSDELLGRLVGARQGVRTGSSEEPEVTPPSSQTEGDQEAKRAPARSAARTSRSGSTRGEPQSEPRREESSSRSGSLSGSRISPREIQERLRAGQTVEQVAEAADVEPAWVERFAGPVLAELALVLRRAMALRVAKARGGPSALPLGAAVAANLASRGISMSEQEFLESWSAASLGGGRWKVAFAFPAKGRLQHAAWLFDVPARSVKPLDPLANQLGHIGGSEDDAAVPTFVAELVDPPGAPSEASQTGTLPLETDSTPPALRRDRGLRSLAGPGDAMATADAEATLLRLVEEPPPPDDDADTPDDADADTPDDAVGAAEDSEDEPSPAGSGPSETQSGDAERSPASSPATARPSRPPAERRERTSGTTERPRGPGQ